jgi:hypothetical protein
MLRISQRQKITVRIWLGAVASDKHRYIADRDIFNQSGRCTGLGYFLGPLIGGHENSQSNAFISSNSSDFQNSGGVPSNE